MGDGTSSESARLVGAAMPCGMLLLSCGTQLGTASPQGCWLSAGTVFSLFLLSPGSASAHQTRPGFPARVIFSSWNIKSALGLVMRAWSYQISSDLPVPANAGLNGAEALADPSHGDVSRGQKQVPKAAALTPAGSFSLSNLIVLEPPRSAPPRLGGGPGKMKLMANLHPCSGGTAGIAQPEAAPHRCGCPSSR